MEQFPVDADMEYYMRFRGIFHRLMYEWVATVYCVYWNIIAFRPILLVPICFGIVNVMVLICEICLYRL